MLFNSDQFLIFLVVVYGLYLLLRERQQQNLMLLIASYVFYGAWDWRFLSLIVGSTLIDFVAAARIDRSTSPRARRGYLVLSLVFNLGMLGFFKYYNFGIESMAELLRGLGLQPHLSTLRIILPVGISFYTFQTISYTVDVYRGERRHTDNLLDFALYVAFFPQLVAGPIERSTRLLPQIQSDRRVSLADVRIGVMWMLLGYFKKVVIADSLGPLVDRAFAHPGDVSGVVSLLAIVGFAAQIYGDFAGYTLIARGIARMMGIHLTINFRAPYLARSPRDFWHRWHISLSSWLRHYLYFSLGGSRCGRVRTKVNLMITMLLGGLWHGAAWNFVIWGAYHGLLLVACHAAPAPRRPFPWPRLKAVAQIAGTFVLTLIGWLLFRTTGLENCTAIVVNILGDFHWCEESLMYLIPTTASLTLLMAYHAWQERAGDELILMKQNGWAQLGVGVFLLTCVWVVGFRQVPFLYFQF